MAVDAIDRTGVLKGLLSKAKVDRIRYAQNGKYRRQAGAQNLENSVLASMQYVNPRNIPSGIGDILFGIANANEDGSTPLSVMRLFNLFYCMPIINTREVRLMMQVDSRQAQRYVRAAKLALPYLEKHLISGGSHEQDEKEVA